jgi:hypothetical protein
MASERKYTIGKLEQAKLNSKWATQRPSAAEETAKVSQQRRNLWDALNEFIRKDGGAAVVSLKYTSPIRIEAATDSELPARLRELGYDLMFREQATRLGPQAVRYDQRGRALPVTGYSAISVNVYELRLPK